jgi:hypothetical protein
MPLSQTPTGVYAATTAQFCPKLPEGQQFVSIPLPGAGTFRCAQPCGGECRFSQGACVAPPKLPARLMASLRLSDTLVALVADALAHPVNVPGQVSTVDERPGVVALVGRCCWGN